MKKWKKPQVINLALSETKNNVEECPSLNLFYETLTPTPNGPNGVENCPWWNGSGCTHKNYGKGNSKNWPCAKAAITLEDLIS